MIKAERETYESLLTRVDQANETITKAELESLRPVGDCRFLARIREA